MGWYKVARAGTEQLVTAKINQILRSNPFFVQVMQDYHIPLTDIENHLHIVFTDLEGKFAEGNGEEIKIDRQLLDDSFFKNNFHFVVHEFFHWVKRRSEALFYFNDDEEIQSFALAMAWELLDGKPEERLAQTFYPIISGHFQDKVDAKQMFLRILTEAKKIATKFRI